MSINAIIDTRLAQVLKLMETAPTPEARARLEAEATRLADKLHDPEPVNGTLPVITPPRPPAPAAAPVKAGENQPKISLDKPIEDDHDFHLTRKYNAQAGDRFSDAWGKAQFEERRWHKHHLARARRALKTWADQNDRVLMDVLDQRPASLHLIRTGS